MKGILLAAAIAAAAVAAAPAGAHPSAAAPGTWCGGSLWKLMTLSDTGRKAVAWSPASTTVGDIAKLSAPSRVATSRSTSFQKQVWQLTAVVQSFRMASNGEIILELFDTKSSAYMDAYMPNPSCLSTATRGRTQILAARSTFMKSCPAPMPAWQTLGATVQLAGVGFWNPSKATQGASPNGAELRPVTGFTLVQGCGKF